ncbi:MULTISPECIES: cytochrome ubiquinol oxidase subunit I [unclassified Nocardioides]|uniref:cytochrome ubiquinol oxidase subunit I n=1 Tax=unclassified Nocardioides TaxID=2615069 RepID=UPI0009F044DB|nr:MULTISPECIES: cytochrome ubiquinol oxidase subunit I [unclassified Nocardioides]GAW47776.1 cytochrome bd ubiquinol oxidase subunit I [Nocardioides sp. PD653-B2]GAW56178.1 cytochrome bd ubiquinol oxidase subunit I [Nocardioides sp. PD653]
MDSILDIARWQFGITTVYHFLFVPLTIGLTLLVAVMETLWVRTKQPAWLRLTRFFGKLMLINFAIGVVTGIVQEFQFGMNWSDYSRFVGDVFGAPLAVEALLAFFLESTFLGLWIFGWDKLPRGLHAGCMWIVHLGTLASSWFILAANSWMQHPVGYTYNPDTGRAELTDFWAVMFNKVQLVTFPHVILAAYMTAGAFVVGVCAWLYVSKRHQVDREVYRTGLRLGAAVALLAGLGVAISGDFQGKVMTEVQPMKMASAEALYDTEDSCAPFSLFTIGTPDGKSEKFSVTVPCVLSFLATGSFDGEVEGINDLRTQYREEYGQDPGAGYYDPSGDYSPVIPITYWTFRYMIGLGVLAATFSALILFLTRKGRAPTSRWFTRMAVATPILMLLGNSAGWIFTEMGRQPWVVFGLMNTSNGVSPGVSVTEAWISVISLTALYGFLAVIEVGLLLTYAKKGADPYREPPSPTLRGSDDDTDKPLAFAY